MTDYPVVDGYHVAQGSLTFQLCKDGERTGVATLAETSFYLKIIRMHKRMLDVAEKLEDHAGLLEYEEQTFLDGLAGQLRGEAKEGRVI